MKLVRIGKFLKELRKEKGLTQEQLGDKVGVTNKTVSRWENGNYMPPVECLALLSDFYGVSINEIVSGQRLKEEEFVETAEANLSDALQLSETAWKETEKRLMITMLISTVLAIVIIMLLPSDHGHFARNYFLIVLVCCLAAISNTVHLAALALNKERYGQKQ